MRKNEKVSNRFTKVPNFIANAKQGLAYWIGYRKVLYHCYPLSESTIVTEFCTLSCKRD